MECHHLYGVSRPMRSGHSFFAMELKKISQNRALQLSRRGESRRKCRFLYGYCHALYGVRRSMRAGSVYIYMGCVMFYTGLWQLDAACESIFVRGVSCFIRGINGLIRRVSWFIRGEYEFIRDMSWFVRGAWRDYRSDNGGITRTEKAGMSWFVRGKRHQK